MCRSIKQLRRPERDVSEAEIEAAVAEIAATTRRLMAAVNALPPEPSDLVQPASAAAIS